MTLFENLCAHAHLRGGAQSRQGLAPSAIVLTDGAPVTLRLTRSVSSAFARPGGKLEFEVAEDVKVDDLAVIRRGTLAVGAVEEARPKGPVGRSGTLAISAKNVRLLDGQIASLRGTRDVKGRSRTAEAVAVISASTILSMPAASRMAAVRGSDAFLAKGTEFVAYINGNFQLSASELRRFQSSAQTAFFVDFKSFPEGAKVFVDQELLGVTPISARLAPGDHSVRISKPGHETWETELSVVGDGEIACEPFLQATNDDQDDE